MRCMEQEFLTTVEMWVFPMLLSSDCASSLALELEPLQESLHLYPPEVKIFQSGQKGDPYMPKACTGFALQNLESREISVHQL